MWKQQWSRMCCLVMTCNVIWEHGIVGAKRLVNYHGDDCFKMIDSKNRLILKSCFSRSWTFKTCIQNAVVKCFIAITHEQESELWHKRYGQLSYKGLSQLNFKGMVIRVLSCRFSKDRVLYAWLESNLD